ncbi:MAG: FkbM family methyltransferase [Rhodospirillales bacterium]|jgi:FkbM family methyltransferase|nr:FkbM family methyltransferase [Rhodospirillales bacterium]MBT4041603.1 FkbM family methyltransferase [Rhodospirillales bacterium]MBT4627813.1 FkbM family methyltransferase [Rhodospirillales bacterium]MBT5352773.1 FkbM family methyltransferase [Rhodospirillales bacterium]MBT5520752.1 FkbM family methyltransferase [Rhodospirillales bacterium]
MDPVTLSKIHQQILSDAQKDRARSPGHGIQQLMTKPVFSGFVEVGFINNVSVSMFLCENDDGVALRCLWNGSFEPMSLALWSVLTNYADCVFDVGAHTGIYSLVAHAINPAAVIVSIEPFPLNFGRLSMNLRANGFTAVHAINAAVSNREGVVPFSVSSAPWYLSSGGTIGSDTQVDSIPVNCTTLDKVMIGGGLSPTLVKLDVEGHEALALQGGLALLDTHSPDIILECIFDQDNQSLQKLLASRGYDFYVIDDDNLALMPVDQLRSTSPTAKNKGRFNRLATKRSAHEILSFEFAAQTLLAKDN